MINEIKNMERIRVAFKEDEYRYVIARIAVHYLKDKTKNRSELHRRVNNVLEEMKLTPISYGFIRCNENNEDRNTSEAFWTKH